MIYQKLVAIAGAALLGISAAHAASEDTKKEAEKKPETKQAQAVWSKACNTDPKSKKEICLIGQQLQTNTGQFLASVAVREITGESRKLLIISVPPGMLILPGMRVQVDKSKHKEAKYTICFPNACYAELVVDKGFIGQLKKGNQLQLTTLNQQAKPVPFKLSLAGFTKTYDGPGMKPEVMERQNRELQKELQKRAEEARKKLIEKQREAVEEQ